MRINHNLASLNTYGRLTTNTAETSKSLEKLSSGLRINKAGDDAAGLAISEKMRAQIRGLDQASRNSQDAISLIQTAEGALSETHSILQRMRELSVQATNGSLTDDDRTKIQAEVNQLTDEIDNIGNQTQFNTKNLLNGSIGQSYSSNNAVGQDGATDYVGVAVRSISANTKSGAYAVDIGTAADKAAVGTTGAFGGGISAGDFIEVNDVRVDFTAGDNRAAIIGKINVKSNETGVEAFINQDGGVAFRSLEYGADAEVNLQSGVAGVLNKLTTGLADTVTDTGADVAGTINGAAATGDGKTLTLTASGNLADGLSVESTNTETAASVRLGWATSAATTTTSLQTLTINGTAIAIASGLNMTAAITAINAQSSSTGVVATAASDNSSNVVLSSVAKGDGSAVNISAIAGGTTTALGFSSTSAAGQIVADGASVASKNASGSDNLTNGAGGDAVVTVESNNNLQFHTGSNADQILQVSISDMRAAAIGKSVNNASQLSSVADLKNKDGVSSVAKAEDSIKVLDEAIKKVSEERAKLGSYQNRLEHTINNLSTSSENLTASESRIRDVDMAKEMMDFTKNNILSQAAQAMLAQANQQPQGVLQLLR